jgi:hypothetical protein
MVEFGDKQISKNHEMMTHHSELNFLTVGDTCSPESIVQKEIGHQIASMENTIISTINKLAAYNPNGYQGVLDSMVPGPAYDYLAKLLAPNPTDFS